MRKSLAKIIALLMFLVAIAAADETTLDTASVMKKVYNFRGGINFSSTWNSRSVFGFHVGGMVDIPLTLLNIADDPYLLEVHPGVQFIKKGGRLWYYSSVYAYSVWGRKFDAYYIEAPVFLSVKRTFSEFVSGRIDFGPYFAFGLFGTNNAFDYLERFDAGMMYGISIDFAKKYSIGVHQGTGLSGDNLSSIYMTLSYKL